MKTIVIFDDHTTLTDLKKINNDLIIIFYSDQLDQLSLLNEYLTKKDKKYTLIFPKDHINRIAKKYKKEFSDFLSKMSTEKLGKQYHGNNTNSSGNLYFYSIPYENNAVYSNIFTLFCIGILINELKEKNNIKEVVNLTKNKILHSLLTSEQKSLFAQESFKQIIRFFYHYILTLWVFILHRYHGRSKYLDKKKDLFFLYYPFYTVEKNHNFFRSHYLKEFQEELETNWQFIGFPAGMNRSEIKNFYRDLNTCRNKKNHSIVYQLIDISYFVLLWIKGLRSILKILFSKFDKNATFCNLNFSFFIQREMCTSYTSGKIIDALLLENLLQKTTSKNKITYLFENFGWERALCFFANKYFSNCEITAYQHFIVGEMYTHFLKHENLPNSYLPSKIGTTGDYSRKVLLNLGWNEQELKPIKGYRYGYLSNIQKTEKNYSSLPLNLIILFSISAPENRSLFQIAKDCFGKNPNYIVSYRTHPACPASEFMDKIPTDWSMANEKTLSEYLKKSHMALCAQGGVIVEALLYNNIIFVPLSNIQINISCIDSRKFKNVFELTSATIESLYKEIPRTTNILENYETFFYS